MDTSFFFISLFRSQRRQQKHQCSLIQHLVCNECVCFVQKRLIVDRVNRYDNVRTNTVTLKPPIHRYLYVPYYLWIARDKSPSLSLYLSFRVHVCVCILSTACNVILCLFVCLSLCLSVCLLLLFFYIWKDSSAYTLHTDITLYSKWDRHSIRNIDISQWNSV